MGSGLFAVVLLFSLLRGGAAPLKVSNGLPNGLAQLRQLGGPEDQQSHRQDQQYLHRTKFSKHYNPLSFILDNFCRRNCSALLGLLRLLHFFGRLRLLCFFGGLMIPMALSTLVVLKGMEHGRYLVLLPVLCAFLTDGGAYFAGVFLGKHRGITKVSPNKSLEGYIGGILSGALFLLLYGVILRQFAGLEVSLPVMAVYGLLGSAVTELGDLSFSLIKRQFGIKDYGNLLPGHGGMLDRFDSMTFAAPTLLILVTLLPAF